MVEIPKIEGDVQRHTRSKQYNEHEGEGIFFIDGFFGGKNLSGGCRVDGARGFAGTPKKRMEDQRCSTLRPVRTNDRRQKTQGQTSDKQWCQ